MKHIKLFEQFDEEEEWWEEEEPVVQKECDHVWALKNRMVYVPHNFTMEYFIQCTKCGKTKEMDMKKK